MNKRNTIVHCLGLLMLIATLSCLCIDTYT